MLIDRRRWPAACCSSTRRSATPANESSSAPTGNSLGGTLPKSLGQGEVRAARNPVSLATALHGPRRDQACRFLEACPKPWRPASLGPGWPAGAGHPASSSKTAEMGWNGRWWFVAHRRHPVTGLYALSAWAMNSHKSWSFHVPLSQSHAPPFTISSQGPGTGCPWSTRSRTV